MRIRAILRFKNEELISRRVLAGFKTQSDLAERIGVSAVTISTWETFKSKPQNPKILQRLLEALDCELYEIFPIEFCEKLYGKINKPVERVFDFRELPSAYKGEYLLPDPQKTLEIKETIMNLGEDLTGLMEALNDNEKRVIKMYFGLGEYKGSDHTYESVGQLMRLSRERIRQILAKALRKLKSSATYNDSDNKFENIRDYQIF